MAKLSDVQAKFVADRAKTMLGEKSIARDAVREGVATDAERDSIKDAVKEVRDKRAVRMQAKRPDPLVLRQFHRVRLAKEFANEKPVRKLPGFAEWSDADRGDVLRSA